MPAYDNAAVAAKLELYADLLEISGADKYRFLAYRKAAKALRAWPEQVAVLSSEGRLTEISGVGAKMASIVEVILADGSFGALDEIAEKLPPTLAGVMRIPGVGPKRAARLHEKLGVSSIEELEVALRQGRVERLGGFGVTTAERIAESLASHRRHTERVPIGEALPAAEQFERLVRAIPGVDRAELAGSIRRRADTVGNIDVVASAIDIAGVADAVAALPAVEGVLERADGHVAVELHDGMRVDVRIVEPRSFGEALRYYTGSFAHNDAFAVLASMRGVEVGPLELHVDGVRVETRDESDVFAAVGVPLLPPEAREGAETLALAAQGAMPVLVTLDDVLGDLQSHSTFTDGRSTLAANREVAAELGYEYLAATDHAYALRMVGGLDLDDLERQWAEIDGLNADGEGLRILKGIELNIAEDGSLDYDDDVLARFDIVLASLHSGWDQDEARVTSRMLSAIEHPLVDVIAHPTGRVLGRRDPLKLDMVAVLEAAGETGTLMEINSYPDRLDLTAENIRLGRSFGVRFTLGTDAHAAEQLRYMPYGVSQARRGLVTRDELLNAWPWETARTWLKRHRVIG